MCDSCSVPDSPAPRSRSALHTDGALPSWSRRTLFGVGLGAAVSVAGLAGASTAYASSSMDGAWCNPALGYFPDGGHYGAPRGSGSHTGQDVTNSTGTGVYAAAAGTVIRCEWGGGLGGRTGEAVVIDHGGDVYTYYGHLSAYRTEVDAEVSAGERIADMGATGEVTGPHLHFETHTGGLGSTTDPVPFMSSRGVDLGGGWPTIDPGAEGERVKVVQHLLNQHGADLEVNGQHDSASVDALKAFQNDQGLLDDGQAGPLTWPKLIHELDSDSSDGDHVRALQVALNKRSVGLEVDGNFGPVMDEAVRNYQELNRLEVDGFVGAVTWEAIVG